MKNKKMKMMTLDQMKDKDIGVIGTPERDKYEFELRTKVVEINKDLEDIKGKILFPKQLALANEMLAKAKLPDLKNVK